MSSMRDIRGSSHVTGSLVHTHLCLCCWAKISQKEKEKKDTGERVPGPVIVQLFYMIVSAVRQRQWRFKANKQQRLRWQTQFVDDTTVGVRYRKWSNVNMEMWFFLFVNVHSAHQCQWEMKSVWWTEPFFVPSSASQSVPHLGVIQTQQQLWSFHPFTSNNSS